MRIIAEVGSCWSNFPQAKDAIQIAKTLGADAVKFQLFNDYALYGYHDLCADQYHQSAWPTGTIWPADLDKLKDKADAAGIEFMCSAFSPELAEAVNPYVETHKIASAELSHVRLLQKINSFKKPVLLSTGASSLADISEALKYLKDCKVTLLYCVSEYPARSVDLKQIATLRGTFKLDVGFSDHTTDYNIIPRLAKEYGAVCIEKHVNFFDVPCADAGHSLSKDEFRSMVLAIKNGEIRLTGEKDMMLRHNRRLIAIRDISDGEKLKEGFNFGIYRSKQDDVNALSGFAVDMVNGKVAKRYYKQGEGIGPEAL